MDSTYWHKQGSEPLFPELEWNKPERRDQAGRLLIAGGNVHSLTAPAKVYERAVQSGIGTVKIALPAKTKRLVGATLPDAVFLPSTNSGEFAQDAASELLEYAQWADTLLLPGDSGRNSQTAILFEQLLRAYNGQLVITRDAADILSNHPAGLFERPRTCVVVSFSQLQKLIQNYGSTQALAFTMGLVQLVDFLHEFTRLHPVALLTLHQDQLVAAYQGQVVTTKLATADEPAQWRLAAATIAACYLTWNPEKQLAALAETAFLTQKTI